MGFVALVLFSLSIIGAVLMFEAMKRVSSLPWLLNFPGAVMAFFAFISFSGWSVGDALRSANMPAAMVPNMPLSVPLYYMAFCVGWYVFAGVLVVRFPKLRRDQAQKPEGE